MTAPVRSMIGDMVSATSIRRPSRVKRTVSNGATRSPRARRSSIARSSSSRSSGTMNSIERPIASAAGYPYMVSAAAFQLVIVPSSALLRIASELNSTTAASHACSLSGCAGTAASGAALIFRLRPCLSA